MSELRIAEPAAATRGIPAALNTAINHLSDLLNHLPQRLPLNPPTSHYEFNLDPTDISEEGYGYALNRCLEVAFKIHSLPAGSPLVLEERGTRLKSLVLLFREAVKKLVGPTDREFFILRWVERITAAAKLAGAKIPAKRCVV